MDQTPPVGPSFRRKPARATSEESSRASARATTPIRGHRIVYVPWRERWRRWGEEGLARHPVSSKRRQVGQLILFLLVLGICYYGYTTRDAAIRKRAIAVLSQVSGGRVEIGAAHFRMFEGITLSDVRVSVPPSPQLIPFAKDPKAWEIFNARSVKLVHNPWRLLLGTLRVEQIIAAQPTITLVHNVETGARNHQLLTFAPAPATEKRPPNRSRLILRAVRLVFVTVFENGREEVRTEELDADVQPTQQITGYTIELRRYSDPAERSVVVFDPTARLVRNAPFVEVQTVRGQLPKAALQFFDQIRLNGQVKITRLDYSTAEKDRVTELALRQVNCKIPLAIISPAAAVTSQPTHLPTSGPAEPEHDAVAMTDVQGQLRLHGTQLEASIVGLVNGAHCEVRGTIGGIGGNLSESHLDLEIQSTGIAAPEGELRKQLIQQSGMPDVLRSILVDYEPHGRFDLSLNLARQKGTGHTVVVTGHFEPKGAQGRYRYFSYPIDDLQGTVRLTENDVFLDRITGRHGSGAVRLDARINRRTHWATIDVRVRGVAAPLDGDLFSALSERYQQIWERFNPQGQAEINLQLHRDGGDENDAPAWHNEIGADLHDCKLELAEYPHAFEDVSGHLVVSSERIDLIGLNGRHGGASVRLDGYAKIDQTAASQVEMRIESIDVPLDNALLSALPRDVSTEMARFHPTGRIDMCGGLSQGASAGDMAPALNYDVNLDWRDGSLIYDVLPCRISDVSGRLRLRSDQFVIDHLDGLYGRSKVGASGIVREDKNGRRGELSLEAVEVPLDAALYEKLPAALRSVWDSLKPQGIVSVRSAMRWDSRDDRVRHQTSVKLQSGQLKFESFPLPLTDVAARADLTENSLSIDYLSGRFGSGRVRVDGTVDFSPPGIRGLLTIDAKGLPFSEEMLTSLPAAMGRELRGMHPAGSFDLRLTPLSFDLDADDQGRWTYAGQMSVRDFSADVGFKVKDVRGSLRGEGVYDTNGPLTLQTTANLDTATLAGWEFQNITGDIRKPADEPSLILDNAMARAYGGQATAFGQVKMRKDRADFELSILARDVKLDRYLSSLKKGPSLTAAPQKEAQGTIRGRLVLRGRSGSDANLEGEGEFFMDHAQVWRLPLLFAIFQVLNLTPDENVFHDGWLKVWLNQDKLTFQNIDLQGKALSFIGQGELRFAGDQLDVNLFAVSPLRWQVPMLTIVLQHLSREFMEIRVTGTLSKPNIRPEPLRTLHKTMESLLRKRPSPEPTAPTKK